MRLCGAIVVLPASPPSNCTPLGSDVAQKLGIGNPGNDLRLAVAAYDHPETCYDREYLFQFMELDPRIHAQAEAQAQEISSCVPANQPAGISCPTSFNVRTEPYRPAYFLINGRSMPDDMDPDYAPNYPHQPYNGNPTCIRVTSRWSGRLGKVDGSIRSTNTAIMFAFWVGTGICS